jgi:hypothetical protein
MKIVIGMHRSGTSLLMNLLQRAGGDLGDPQGFYPCDRWNPDGYFEQQEILSANRELLHGPLGRLAFFFPPGEHTIRQRGRRMQARLRETGRRYTGKLVKDPRFLFTSPAWEDTGTTFSHVLVALREPDEVAASLNRRNRLPRFLAMKMMLEHYRRLLVFTSGRPTRWVRYDRLVAAGTSVAEFSAAAEFLGLPFRVEADSAWFKSIVRLRTHDHPEPVTNYPQAVTELWAELCRRHQSQAPV